MVSFSLFYTSEGREPARARGLQNSSVSYFAASGPSSLEKAAMGGGHEVAAKSLMPHHKEQDAF